MQRIRHTNAIPLRRSSHEGADAPSIFGIEGPSKGAIGKIKKNIWVSWNVIDSKGLKMRKMGRMRIPRNVIENK